jgi:uncharacterized phage protein (TIGR01671 family)
MDREIKFRAWHKQRKTFIDLNGFSIYFGNHQDKGEIYGVTEQGVNVEWSINDIEILQFTGIKDSDGVEIYEGAILEFSNKWEWYKGSYGMRMRFADEEALKKLKEDYANEPMERRKIEMPSCYEWILSGEIQSYWKVVGNIYENPELCS